MEYLEVFQLIFKWSKAYLISFWGEKDMNFHVSIRLDSEMLLKLSFALYLVGELSILVADSYELWLIEPPACMHL